MLLLLLCSIISFYICFRLFATCAHIAAWEISKRELSTDALTFCDKTSNLWSGSVLTEPRMENLPNIVPIYPVKHHCIRYIIQIWTVCCRCQLHFSVAHNSLKWTCFTTCLTVIHSVGLQCSKKPWNVFKLVYTRSISNC